MNALLDDAGRRCAQTRETCLKTILTCLVRGGRVADAALCAALSECAQTCRLCAESCASGPERGVVAAESCAQLCDACARRCDAFGEPELAACAEALRRCAEACRKLRGGVCA